MTFVPDWSSFVSASTNPALFAARRRNTFLDWLFYDVESLTPAERAMLIHQRNTEGSILVVRPTGEKGVRKFEDYAALRSEPGKLLQRFTIAGVGSSDVGAAAFARTLADHYGEPVGAIVAGYGISDLLSEALGGWFVLGAANRMMALYQSAEREASGASLEITKSTDATLSTVPEAASGRISNDTLTLLRLLKDTDREILSVAGHSKGCLSIAYALEALFFGKDKKSIAKAKKTRVVTTGAVVALPEAVTNVGQYIGAVDWFGGMNSRLENEHIRIPNAWHHLNTTLPLSFDFSEVLKAYER